VIWWLHVGYGYLRGCGVFDPTVSRPAVGTEFSALPPLISASASLLPVVCTKYCASLLFKGRNPPKKLRRILCHASTSSTSYDLLISEEIWGRSHVKMDSVLEATIVEMRLFIVRWAIWQFSVLIPFRILGCFKTVLVFDSIDPFPCLNSSLTRRLVSSHNG